MTFTFKRHNDSLSDLVNDKDLPEIRGRIVEAIVCFTSFGFAIGFMLAISLVRTGMIS
jgi:hypothetical protein